MTTKLPDTPKTIEWKTIARWIVGLLVSALFCTATIIVLMGDDREIRLLVMGALIGSFTTVVGYYFGSSEKSD